MRRPGQIVTRAMLLEDVWNFNFMAQTNVVDVQIGNLRRKLDPTGARRFIVNIRAVGFKLHVDRLRSSRHSAFRLALGFALAVSVATAAAFAFIYMQVSSAEFQRWQPCLSRRRPRAWATARLELRHAFELPLTRDIRRLDFAALIDAEGHVVFGNVPSIRQFRSTAKRTSFRTNCADPRRGSRADCFCRADA